MRCKPSLTLNHNPALVAMVALDAEFLAAWATPALLMPSKLVKQKTF
jgi:hypothetical protein